MCGSPLYAHVRRHVRVRIIRARARPRGIRFFRVYNSTLKILYSKDSMLKNCTLVHSTFILKTRFCSKSKNSRREKKKEKRKKRGKNPSLDGVAKQPLILVTTTFEVPFV